MLLDTVLDPTADAGAATALEDAGFGCAWVTETVRDPYLCLAAAAGTTGRMRLGTSVAVAFARSPMVTALCAHDVQRACGGRLLLGLGTQVRAHIERRFAMPWSRPVDRMREYVAALRAIWAHWTDGAPLEFRGEFYTHTLASPVFDPGPTGHPAPPVLLAGVGARMTALAGEVADGFIAGPLTSARSFAEHTLPALRSGFAAGSRTGEPFETCVMPLVVTGADRAQTDRVAHATRARLAFYASTPAYRDILDLHGWAGLHERLHALSRRGAWDEMTALVDDDVLRTFAVVAPPEKVAVAVRERFGSHARRAIVHGAADPGMDVWRTVAAAR